jgi:hypothetical protein
MGTPSTWILAVCLSVRLYSTIVAWEEQTIGVDPDGDVEMTEQAPSSVLADESREEQ